MGKDNKINPKDEGFELDFADKQQLVEISSEIKKDFLDYAMSTIVARAIPDVRDGLKPVTRRIIYAMKENGFTYSKGYNKSAKIVGAVMGNYHPHGDSSIYGAMVHLAQPFNTRYTLVDGHGNFGNIDGYGAAAQRYTEARLTKLAEELVRDIEKNTVDFIPTYDGTGEEPTVLPSYFPNLLVNGTIGIAVGMATNMPPHNLGEVIDGLIAYQQDPNIDVPTLMNNYIHGPDFPNGATIMGRLGIRKAYETGRGSFIVRANYEIEEYATDRQRIVFTDIPYQVNKKVDIIEKIVDIMKDKNSVNIPGQKELKAISEIRDESNIEGIRIVIELKKDTNVDLVLNSLFKFTALQKNYSLCALVLVNNVPKTLGILDIMKEFLAHQEITLIRKTKCELAEAEKRMHILRGLIKILSDVDTAIKIIRNEPTLEEIYLKLNQVFGIDEIQIKAVLSIQLRTLASFEIARLQTEYSELEQLIIHLTDILNNVDLRKDIIKNNLLEIKASYADERRTIISEQEGEIVDEELIPKENIFITLTKTGYIKRIPQNTYKSQKRGGKGLIGMTTYEEDEIDQVLLSNTHTDVLFFTNLAKVYKLRAHELPSGNRYSKGIPIVNLLKNLSENERVLSIIAIESYNEQENLIFVSKNGVVKKTSTADYSHINVNGKKALIIKEDDQLVKVLLVKETQDVFIATAAGKVIRFDNTKVRVMGRVSTGVKGINTNGSYVIDATSGTDDLLLFVISEKGLGKLSEISQYRSSNRGGMGIKTINITDKTGSLLACRAVTGKEDALITSQKGIVIRTSLQQLRNMGRATQGVKLINLNHGDLVSSIEFVDHIDEDVAEDTNNNIVTNDIKSNDDQNKE